MVVVEMMLMSAASRFKTPESEARFLAAYDATLGLWPVPHEVIEVTTRFGSTHINVAGSPDLPPLALDSRWSDQFANVVSERRAVEPPIPRVRP